MTAEDFRIVVLERRGHWAQAWRRAIARSALHDWPDGRLPRIVETRHADDFYLELAQAEAALGVWEFEAPSAAALARWQALAERRGSRRLALVVVGAPALRELEAELRELGALAILTSLVEAPTLVPTFQRFAADAAAAVFDQVSLAEQVWRCLPWSRAATGPCLQSVAALEQQQTERNDFDPPAKPR